METMTSSGDIYTFKCIQHARVMACTTLLLYSCTYTNIYVYMHACNVHMYRKIESSVLPCAGTRGGISRDLAVMSVTVTG